MNDNKAQKGALHEIEVKEKKSDVKITEPTVSNQLIRGGVSFIIISGLILIILGIIAPNSLSAVINIFLVIFAGFFVLFIILGIAVLIGAKERVGNMLSEVFEGSLKIIDFIELIKTLMDELLSLCQEIFLFCIPINAIALSILLYYLLLVFLRIGGSYVNAGILIIALTFFVVSLLNVLNIGQMREEKETFSKRFKYRFRRYFVDYAEITVAIFFLTMDIPNHFMLAKKYWGEIHANFFNVDLMARGFSTQHGIRIGLSLAGVALFAETLRRIYKILMTAARNYRDNKEQSTGLSRFSIMKTALRDGFAENLDDLIKYFGYNTVLLLVFMFLPRLKLLSMITFSVTNLVWDIALPKRIFIDKESEDLLSRLIVKTFKL